MIDVSGLDSLNDLIKKAQHDAQILSSITKDPYFIQRAEEIIAQNFDEVWDSEGGVIGSDWNGRDLVQTGNLRDSLTNGGSLKVTISGNMIIFGSTVEYAQYVNDDYPFFGFTQYTAQRLGDLIGEFLQIRGELDWS
jgi:hypothetical protein